MLLQWPDPISTSPMQPQQLQLRESYGRGARKLAKARIPGYLLGDSIIYILKKAIPLNSQQYGCPNKFSIMISVGMPVWARKILLGLMSTWKITGGQCLLRKGKPVFSSHIGCPILSGQPGQMYIWAKLNGLNKWDMIVWIYIYTYLDVTIINKEKIKNLKGSTWEALGGGGRLRGM